MLVLKKLKWGKCFSYGDNNEIDLQANKITQLVGVNGAGKSSIPLILEEVCFNKNSKGVKKGKIPNRELDGNYWISVEFSRGNDEYEVHLDRKSSVKLKLLKNGEDISGHTATSTFKAIEELFGKSFNVASQLIYQGNTSSLQFLTDTDTNRKKFLISLFELDRYTQIGETFKKLAKTASDAVIAAEGKVSMVEGWLEKSKNADLTISVLEDVPEDGSAYQQEYDQLSSKLSRADAHNKAVIKNNRIRKQIDEFDMTAIIKAKGIAKNDTSNLLREKGGLEGELKRSEALIKKIKSLGDSCPTCLQDITPYTHISILSETEREVSKAESRLREIEATLSTILKQNNLVDAAAKKERDLQELHRMLDSDLDEELVDVQDLQNKLRSATETINAKVKKHKEVLAENARRKAQNARVETLIEQRSEYERELGSLKAELSTKRQELSTLEILKKAFSTNGLVAYKLENVVQDLETVVNEYLAELSDGRFSISFVVVSDKLKVSLTDNGDDIEITELSSGELARVNTATLLAIRKVMASLSKTNINVLFLDEVINALDQEARERLVEVLIKEPSLNTFIVSHGWTHPLLSKIDVIKTNGMSKLVVDG